VSVLVLRGPNRYVEEERKTLKFQRAGETTGKGGGCGSRKNVEKRITNQKGRGSLPAAKELEGDVFREEEKTTKGGNQLDILAREGLGRGK